MVGKNSWTNLIIPEINFAESVESQDGYGSDFSVAKKDLILAWGRVIQI